MADVITNITNAVKDGIFPQEKVEQAYSLMLSDVRKNLPAKITKAVTGVYAIKATEVREAGNDAKNSAEITKGKSIGSIKLDNLTLTYKGRRLTLAHFRLSPATKPSKKRYKVKATIFKGKRVTVNGKSGLPAFIAPTSRKDPSGKPWIAFMRQGKDRLPITAIRTVSLPQMMTNEEVAEVINTEKEKMVLDRFQHHIDRLTKTGKEATATIPAKI